MDKLSKTHVLYLLAALLLITPFSSSNLRPTYLYFITNILIVALGAEAGLLSFFSNSPHGKQVTTYSNKNTEIKSPALWQLSYPPKTSDSDQSPRVVTASDDATVYSYETITSEKAKKDRDRIREVENCLADKVGVINAGYMKENKFKKCPSMPSLFFIAGVSEARTGDWDPDSDFDSDREDEAIASGQELFTKAEASIGNFYKQLKMQREESWKRIHGFYQKAF